METETVCLSAQELLASAENAYNSMCALVQFLDEQCIRACDQLKVDVGRKLLPLGSPELDTATDNLDKLFSNLVSAQTICGVAEETIKMAGRFVTLLEKNGYCPEEPDDKQEKP